MVRQRRRRDEVIAPAETSPNPSRQAKQSVQLEVVFERGSAAHLSRHARAVALVRSNRQAIVPSRCPRRLPRSLKRTRNGGKIECRTRHRSNTARPEPGRRHRTRDRLSERQSRILRDFGLQHLVLLSEEGLLIFGLRQAGRGSRELRVGKV